MLASIQRTSLFLSAHCRLRTPVAAIAIGLLVWLAPAASAKSVVPSRSSTGIPEPFPPRLLRDGLQLWISARNGWSTRESAAWIIENGDGTYHLDWWPQSRERYRAIWTSNSAPDHAVGILHTHPNSVSPRPSMSSSGSSDQVTANRTRLPVYVLHLKGIWKIEPGAKKVRKIEDSRWFRRLRRSM